MQTAADYFQQAILADPGYANAYAGLAQSELLMPFYDAGRSQDTFPKAKAAASRAIALDENSPEGHVALAMLLCYDFEFNESEAEFKRALEFDPNYATAHHWYGNTLLTTLGRFDEAIKEGQRAIELDPLSLIINADLGTTFMLARRYDEAIAQLRSTLTLDNNFAYAHQNLGLALFVKGNIEAAIAEYEKAQKLNDSCDILALLVCAYSGLGRKSDALQTFDKFEQCAQNHTVRNHVYAVAHMGVGDNGAAISYLEKSPESWLRIDPLLDPLRGDPRFQKLVAKWFVQDTR